MALTQRRDEIRDNVRRMANVEGTTALVRHPNTDLNDYINRALGSCHRILTDAIPDQRLLSSDTFSTASGTTLYALAATFDSLISVSATANGHTWWLEAYEMHERPMLVSPDTTYTGVPFTYRLRGSNVELLPTPTGVYSITLWFTPTVTQFTADSDTYDTISRLDDYLIPYAARFVALKNGDTKRVQMCDSLIEEYRSEVQSAARKRDQNSPPRIVDEMRADRYGRRRWR